MASIERTAYPPFPRTLTLKDLQGAITARTFGQRTTGRGRVRSSMFEGTGRSFSGHRVEGEQERTRARREIDPLQYS